MPAAPSEITGELKASGQVKLDSSGNGVLIFDPDHANQRWEVTGVVVSTNQPSTSTVVPWVTLAKNTTALSTMSAGNNAGQSWQGNQESFSGLWPIGPCDFLAVIFAPPAGQSGAPLSGVIASAVVSGTKYTRRG